MSCYILVERYAIHVIGSFAHERREVERVSVVRIEVEVPRIVHELGANISVIHIIRHFFHVVPLHHRASFSVVTTTLGKHKVWIPKKKKIIFFSWKWNVKSSKKLNIRCIWTMVSQGEKVKNNLPVFPEKGANVHFLHFPMNCSFYFELIWQSKLFSTLVKNKAFFEFLLFILCNSNSV